MKILSVISYLAAAALGIIILISTFATLIKLWGTAGAVISVFLLPVAVIIYPMIQWLVFGLDPGGYLFIGAFIGLLWLGGYLSDKAEEKG